MSKNKDKPRKNAGGFMRVVSKTTISCIPTNKKYKWVRGKKRKYLLNSEYRGTAPLKS